MVSKIITIEKERQERIIREHTAFMGDCPEIPKPFQYKNPVSDNHKQSLINLKEYMEYVWQSIDSMKTGVTGCDAIVSWKGLYNNLKEDIAELTKMIEAYA